MQAPHLPEPLAEYREFFGVPIGRAERPRQRMKLHAVPGGAVQQDEEGVRLGGAFIQAVMQRGAVAGGVGLQIGQVGVGNGR